MAADGTGDADGQAAFASTMVDEWVRSGVAHAVVCPGSRSSPLSVALAAHPGMVVHVRLDERSAGFTALGIGLATGHPALVVTTSGTAAAELHASVVEADLAGVALIACTADRPPELRDVGAPQTIDQTHLFGRSVRWFGDPGVPDRMARQTWRSLASRSVAEATSGPGGPGPVHLNLPFREPLLGDAGAAGGAAPGRPGGARWHEVIAGPMVPPGNLVSLFERSGTLHRESRGLIVAGAGCGDPDAVLALSAALGWPVLADPRSGARRPWPGVIGAADGILRSDRFARDHRPDVVLRLGHRWVSKVVNEYLSLAVNHGAGLVVVDPVGRWTDPERDVTAFVRCDPTLACRALTERVASLDAIVPVVGGAIPWGEEWRRAEAGAWAVISDALAGDAGRPMGAASLTEPGLAHCLAARMPADGTLVVSSSMPIRDVEAFAQPRDRPPRILANRGANGIDGVMSTAWGVALGNPGPTVALVGDLAFLHDVSALVGAAGSTAPLTVVVADNGGGGIFSFLDPAAKLAADSFETLFGTPQSQDVATVAAGFGWPVDDVPADAPARTFDQVLDRRMGEGRCSVIRVQLPQRSENVAVHQRLNAAIVDAVEAGLDRAQQGRGS
jgi:2-succinyl-5-enolpyruvyl-6-hydroxy-3-cyclohexene-1-carboxylate synthase